MTIEIVKYGEVVANGEDLTCITDYAREHQALVGYYGAQLVVCFEDGARCDAVLGSEDEAAAWVKDAVAHGRKRFIRASRVANFRVLVFDESRNWSPDFLPRAGGKVFATYLYDALAPTHCCELTPSYYLRHLFSTPATDNEDGEVAAYIRQEEACDDSSHYLHCRSIDRHRIMHEVYNFGLDLIDDKGEIRPTHESLEEEYAEYCNANGGGLEDLPRVDVRYVTPWAMMWSCKQSAALIRAGASRRTAAMATQKQGASFIGTRPALH